VSNSAEKGKMYSFLNTLRYISYAIITITAVRSIGGLFFAGYKMGEKTEIIADRVI
jgi:hypothetical protein